VLTTQSDLLWSAPFLSEIHATTFGYLLRSQEWIDLDRMTLVELVRLQHAMQHLILLLAPPRENGRDFQRAFQYRCISSDLVRGEEAFANIVELLGMRRDRRALGCDVA
jgi:hypothetical protein